MEVELYKTCEHREADRSLHTVEIELVIALGTLDGVRHVTHTVVYTRPSLDSVWRFTEHILPESLVMEEGYETVRDARSKADDIMKEEYDANL